MEMFDGTNADWAKLLTSEIAQKIKELREFKDRHPELRSCYVMHPGGLLNAYREGDITFDEAVKQMREVISPQRDAREMAHNALTAALHLLMPSEWDNRLYSDLKKALTEIANYPMPPADSATEAAWQSRLYRLRSCAREAIGMEDN